MSRRDFYHDHVVEALVAAGWMIEADPFKLPFFKSAVKVDLSAIRVAKDGTTERIAVEIKNFISRGKYITEFEKGLGQYLLYSSLIETEQLAHQLFLAVPDKAFRTFFARSEVQRLLIAHRVNVVTFDPQSSTIVSWKPHAEIGR